MVLTLKSTMMKIAFSPPFIDQNVIDEVVDSLESRWITSGPKVQALEAEMTKLSQCEKSICVNSWTSGAIMMLKWFGIKAGDEVIIPAYSYCATALCVLHCGATPVMVDIADDLTIDPIALRKAITAKTKVVISVDIAGLPAKYEAIRTILESKSVRGYFNPSSEKQQALGRILLLADAAHSIGASYHGLPAALKSDVTIYSFHAVKNITTAEGGCICLNLPRNFDHDEEYKFLKIFALNGQNKDAYAKSKGANWKYDILYQGLKINMPDICAAIGLAQIRQYEELLLPSRKHIALKYCSHFNRHKWFIAPTLMDQDRESSYHVFPLRIRGINETERDQIIEQLVELGITVNVHFIPMPMLSLFRLLGYKIADFPNSYRQYACEISLPIYPQLRTEEVDYIIAAVIRTVNHTLKIKDNS